MRGRRIAGLLCAVLFPLAIWSMVNIYAHRSSDLELAKKVFAMNSLFDPHLISHVDTRDKLVALTFDDGPDPRYTPEVLDILSKYHVRATFFVVGQSARAYPDLVCRECREGHEVENHTYTHPDLNRDSEVQVIEELAQTQETIAGITGRRPAYFRPPRRLFNAGVVDVAADMGMDTVLWTIGVEHHSCRTPEEMANRVLKKARPGIIILAHDGRLNRTRTVEALPLVIEGYEKRGYRFVTLEELVSAANKQD